jgi:superfamily II RNA helicase
MAHEYTQAAGRSGRRGLDTVGHVIHCNNLFEYPTLTEYKEIMGGKPQKLVSKFHISYGVTLNLLSLCTPISPEQSIFQTFTVDKMTEFVKKSMLFDEINGEINRQQTILEEVHAAVTKKEEYFKIMPTPKEVCERYINIECDLAIAINKKKKALQKELDDIKMNHKYLLQDVKSVREYRILARQYISCSDDLTYVEKFIPNQIEKLLAVLSEKGFVINNDEEYLLTTTGIVASHIAEIHPLAITHCMFHLWNHFANFTVYEVVGVLSCFTDIKMKQECVHSIPTTENVFLKERVYELKDILEKYEKIESDRNIKTGIHYENILIYDLIDVAIQWCFCDTETECKQFIQTVLYTKDISVGDFAKAIMKINAIVKELINVYEYLERVDIVHKLNQIPCITLKYITINQSLYI